jgi:hypothetical protein
MPGIPAGPGGDNGTAPDHLILMSGHALEKARVEKALGEKAAKDKVWRAAYRGALPARWELGAPGSA